MINIERCLVWDNTDVNSPSTFDPSLAVNFQMSRSIYDNKPATPDVTVNRFNSATVTFPLSGGRLIKTCDRKDKNNKRETYTGHYYEHK